MIQNPCKGICKIHPEIKVCMGCYRSLLELRQWVTASDEKKQEIIESCRVKKEIYGELI